MKFVLILTAWVLATLAIPVAHHGDHHHGNPAGNTVTGTTGSATPAPQQNNANANQGNNRGGNGDQHRGGNHVSAAPPAQTAANPPPAATQAPNTANSGQNANNGQNTNGGQNSNNGAVNANFVPDFGQQAGLSPDGTGNCKANSGKLIPCQCPPSRAAFVQKLNQFVAAGSFPGGLPAPFPTGNTNQDALTRINTIISALQNFDGAPGKGCPAVSAPNFAVVQSRIQQGALS